MWDIGGQESLRQAWSTYYASTHFLILVVDSTDRERLEVTREELYNMLEHEVHIYPCTCNTVLYTDWAIYVNSIWTCNCIEVLLYIIYNILYIYIYNYIYIYYYYYYYYNYYSIASHTLVLLNWTTVWNLSCVFRGPVRKDFWFTLSSVFYWETLCSCSNWQHLVNDCAVLSKIGHSVMMVTRCTFVNNLPL